MIVTLHGITIDIIGPTLDITEYSSIHVYILILVWSTCSFQVLCEVSLKHFHMTLRSMPALLFLMILLFTLLQTKTRQNVSMGIFVAIKWPTSFFFKYWHSLGGLLKYSPSKFWNMGNNGEGVTCDSFCQTLIFISPRGVSISTYACI